MTSDEKRDAIADVVAKALAPPGYHPDPNQKWYAEKIAGRLLEGIEVPGVATLGAFEQPEHPYWGEHPYCVSGGKGLCWHGPGAEDDDVPLFRQVTP